MQGNEASIHKSTRTNLCTEAFHFGVEKVCNTGTDTGQRRTVIFRLHPENEMGLVIEYSLVSSRVSVHVQDVREVIGNGMAHRQVTSSFSSLCVFIS